MALGSPQPAQVIDTRRHIPMVGTEGGYIDLQGALTLAPA